MREEIVAGENTYFKNKEMGQKRDTFILLIDGQRSFLKEEIYDLDLKGQVNISTGTAPQESIRQLGCRKILG